MRVIAALGGNALLKRDEAPTIDNQRRNARVAAQALAPVARSHTLVVTHGSGPQVGRLALQSATADPAETVPFDVLDAEAEGQIGYLIELELRNALRDQPSCITVLTQIAVDPDDPAFDNPTKPIGPFCDAEEAERLERSNGWRFARIGESWRRVVASPRPLQILQIGGIETLVAAGIVPICAGGGGIPVMAGEDGAWSGVEAVIDKDLASALLARDLGARALLLLTDVDGVYVDWDTPAARRFRRVSPETLAGFPFAAGSMGPKVAAACDFVSETGGIAGIGLLGDTQTILDGTAGTLIEPAAQTEYWD